MKKILLSVLALASVMFASAQEIGGYTAVTSTGTYTALDGATVVNTGIKPSDLGGMAILSDATGAANTAITGKGFAIGFDFPFNGKTMKYFGIGANGLVKLSETEEFTMSTPRSYGSPYQLATASGGDNLVYSYDAYAQSYTPGAVDGMDSTTISYKTEGDELVVEYKNLGIIKSSWSTELIGTYSLQIHLKKDGTIAYVYSGLSTLSSTSIKFYLGLRGNDGEYVMWTDGLTATNRAFGGYGTQYLSAVADGYTVTLNTPVDVVAPTTQPTNLTYNVDYYDYKTQVGAEYTACDADKYLMIVSEGAPTVLPVDGTNYATGDSLGNAYVMSSSKAGSTGYSGNLKHATEYTITVYAYNSYGKNGPKYNTVNPLQTTFTTSAEKPASFKLLSATKDEMEFSVESNESNDLVYVVYNDCTWNPGNYGSRAFTGTPSTSALEPGDDLYAEVVTLNRETWENDTTIEKAGKVAFCGLTGKFKLTNLKPGSSYYFIAYSYDVANGTFSQGADTLQVWAATNIVAPYKMDITGAPERQAAAGWETGATVDNAGYGFMADDPDYPSVASQDENGRAYMCQNSSKKCTYSIKTPTIELGDNTISFDWHIHYNAGRWGMKSYKPYDEWNEDDLLQFVLYVGDKEVVLSKYDSENAPEDTTAYDWHHETFDISEYAGQDVKFGIKWLCANSSTTYFGFENLALDNNYTVDFAIDYDNYDDMCDEWGVFANNQRLEYPYEDSYKFVAGTPISVGGICVDAIHTMEVTVNDEVVADSLFDPDTKVYTFPLAENTTVKVSFIDPNATAINTVEATDNNAPVYNIAGQRVNGAQKGIMIQNRKKFLNK